MYEPKDTSERLRILAEARLVSMKIGPVNAMRPAGQKAILFTLLAFDGRPVSSRVIADMAGMGATNVASALVYLRKAGLIKAQHLAKTNKLRVYHFNWERLLAIGRTTPLVGTSGWEGRRIKQARDAQIKAINLLKGPQCDQTPPPASEFSPSTPVQQPRDTPS